MNSIRYYLTASVVTAMLSVISLTLLSTVFPSPGFLQSPTVWAAIGMLGLLSAAIVLIWRVHTDRTARLIRLSYVMWIALAGVLIATVLCQSGLHTRLPALALIMIASGLLIAATVKLKRRYRKYYLWQ